MRGYSRRQVDAFVASSRSQVRNLEEQLARSLGETEQQMLDQATARASAIDDGAERRLSLLTVAHTETMRQLTAIRDAVTTVVAADTARGPLEDEVAKSAAATLAADRESGLELTGAQPGHLRVLSFSRRLNCRRVLPIGRLVKATLLRDRDGSAGPVEAPRTHACEPR